MSNHIRFGVISDTHIGSKWCRHDVLDAIYDVFEQRGVKMVYHSGNIIDGYIPRINGNEVLSTTLDGQVKMCLELYPKKKGMVTKFLIADDHCGWFTKDSGIDVGKYLELKAIDMGRKDLVYIGYMECDMIYNVPNNKTFVVRVVHCGGGAARTISYTPQQLIHSYVSGGEKVDLILAGHFHKQGIFRDLGVMCILASSTMQQSSFMRKKRLHSDLGGYVVDVRFDKFGNPISITPEYLNFNDYNKERWKFPDLT